jgi:uncharacterized protein (TIGR03382 family)
MRRVALAASVVLPCLLARSAAPAPIIGGTEAQSGQFPNVVAIAIGSASRFALCTGELIEPDIVMTAAHCLSPAVICPGSGSGAAPTCTTDQITAMTTVFANTIDIMADPGTQITASATVFDPGFEATNLGHNDMGLITLSSPLTGIALAVPNLHHDDAPPGIVVEMVGYGATEQGAMGTVGTEFFLQGRASESCTLLPALSGASASDDNLLCYSQTDGKGKCEGDSGGPSFAVIDGSNTKVVGTTSFGDSQCAQLGTDTRPDAEHRFLYAHIPDLECTTDAMCDGGRSCYSGQCVLPAGMPGSIGQGCTKDAQCDTGECNAAPDGTKVCAIECAVSDGSAGCPAGFECVESGSASSCFDGHTGGGCCDAGGQGAPTALLLGGVVAVAARRRRR